MTFMIEVKLPPASSITVQMPRVAENTFKNETKALLAFLVSSCLLCNGCAYFGWKTPPDKPSPLTEWGGDFNQPPMGLDSGL